MVSVLSAAVIELPLAVVALIGARRLLRLTIGRLELLSGFSGPVPAFWQVPLFGDTPVSYRTLLRKTADLEADCAGQEAGCADEEPGDTSQEAEFVGRDSG